MWGTCYPRLGVDGAVGGAGVILACDEGLAGEGACCKFKDEGAIILATVSVIVIVVLVQVLVLDSEIVGFFNQFPISQDRQESNNNTCTLCDRSKHLEWEWWELQPLCSCVWF